MNKISGGFEGIIQRENSLLEILKNKEDIKLKQFLYTIEKDTIYYMCRYFVGHYTDHIQPSSFKIILEACNFFIDDVVLMALLDKGRNDLTDVYFEFGPEVINKLIEEYEKKYEDAFREERDFTLSQDPKLAKKEKEKRQKSIKNALDYLKPNKLM